MKIKSTNPTLLTLLRIGCTIEFPNGYRLHGDTDTKYIDTSNEFGSDGIWCLDKDGLKRALTDIKNRSIRG